MFALAEALHAHGHVRESSRLARQLAGEMLANHAIELSIITTDQSTTAKSRQL